jgi:hypothetical protein
LRFFGLILENIFVVFLVFGLLISCRETANESTIKKVDGKGKTTGKKGGFLSFFGQKLLTWTFPKKFFVVFLNLNFELPWLLVGFLVSCDD